MFFCAARYFMFFIVLTWNIFLPNAYAQTQVLEPVFTDTTQKLLEKSRKNVLSSKRIADRQILLKRLSKDCRPEKKPLPPQCRLGNRPVSNTSRIIQKQPTTSQQSQQSFKKIAGTSSQSSSAATGGISIGVATMGLGAIIAVAGAAILTFFSVAGYGDDAAGSSSVSATPTTN